MEVLMLLQILLVLTQSSFAAAIPVNEAELLQATGLEKSFIEKQNEDALESLLFIQNNGVSCGLDELSIEGYNVTEGTAQAPTKFEVINLVSAPTNYCASYEVVQCYTYFYLKNNQWETLGAECAEGSGPNE
jgi:hypothetical protein